MASDHLLVATPFVLLQKGRLSQPRLTRCLSSFACAVAISPIAGLDDGESYFR